VTDASQRDFTLAVAQFPRVTDACKQAARLVVAARGCRWNDVEREIVPYSTGEATLPQALDRSAITCNAPCPFGQLATGSRVTHLTLHHLLIAVST